jgi:hypothetical protein
MQFGEPIFRSLISKTAPKVIRQGVGALNDKARESNSKDRGVVQRMALNLATTVGEKLAKRAIKRNLPSAVRETAHVPHLPPVELYTTGEEECKSMYPPVLDAAIELAGDLAARSDESIAEHYARVLTRSSFEREMCRAHDDGPLLEHLVASLPTVVAESKHATVAIAEMLARTTGFEAMRKRLILEVRAAAEPPSGLLSSLLSSGPSADDLRSFEVVHRLLGHEKPAALVARARAAAWESVIGNTRLDMTRHGSMYGVVPLRHLRDFTVQFMPDPAPVQIDHLGQWGVLESARKLAHLAATRFSASQPEFADQMVALARNGASLGSELMRLYVTRQHTGYEPAGTGYALAAAIGALGAVATDKANAHAATCLLEYIRALLFVDAPATAVPGDAAIDAFVKRMPERKPKRPAPFAMPRVPLACRATPAGDDARSRSLVRKTCARNAELVRKSSALARLARDEMSVDELFALFADLDVLATDERVAERVRNMLPRTAATVGQKRRLAVLQTRLAEVTGVPMSVLPTGSSVYEHIEQRAGMNKPHGLEAHELGVAHWAVPGVPIRVPFLTNVGTSLAAWILRELAPPVADVLDAATEPVIAVQYKADERPGVGFALYTLLPLLDHASEMRETRSEYTHVHRATLSAIRRLLAA